MVVLQSNFFVIVLRARSARNTITWHEYPLNYLKLKPRSVKFS